MIVIKVKKRDGRVVLFDVERIISAISKAGDVPQVVKMKIAKEIESIGHDLAVEDIQDMVEKKLMSTKYKDVAKSYINYRYLHGLSRTKYEELIGLIREKSMAESVKNQNANVDEYSFGGRVGETADALMKKYALDYCMSEKMKNNHLNNEVYVHDLGQYAIGSHNCLSIPFDDLLKNGFTTRQTDVRPANSVNTAFQLLAVIFQLQSLQQFGGVSATHIDHTMTPYVRISFYKHFRDGMEWLCDVKDFSVADARETSIDSEIYKRNEKVYKYAYDMTIKEIYQAIEGMYHNLNTLQSRSGNQLPFTSINYGTCTLTEGRLIIKALLDVSIEGIGSKHRTSIFPK